VVRNLRHLFKSELDTTLLSHSTAYTHFPTFTPTDRYLQNI
jgi:hypothetical protein